MEDRPAALRGRWSTGLGVIFFALGHHLLDVHMHYSRQIWHASELLPPFQPEDFQPDDKHFDLFYAHTAAAATRTANIICQFAFNKFASFVFRQFMDTHVHMIYVQRYSFSPLYPTVHWALDLPPGDRLRLSRFSVVENTPGFWARDGGRPDDPISISSGSSYETPTHRRTLPPPETPPNADPPGWDWDAVNEEEGDEQQPIEEELPAGAGNPTFDSQDPNNPLQLENSAAYSSGTHADRSKYTAGIGDARSPYRRKKWP